MQVLIFTTDMLGVLLLVASQSSNVFLYLLLDPVCFLLGLIIVLLGLA